MRTAVAETDGDGPPGWPTRFLNPPMCTWELPEEEAGKRDAAGTSDAHLTPPNT